MKLVTTLKEISPQLCLVGGVVGVVGGIVMACRATRKLDATLEESKDEINDIHDKREELTEEEYSAKEMKKDLTKAYAKSGLKLVKLYGPSAAVVALSLGGIVKSNDILRKRNTALAAAYAALDGSFKVYRNRVIDKFGEDVDAELRLGTREEKCEETVEVDGKKKKVKNSYLVTDGKSGENGIYYFSDSALYKGIDDYDFSVINGRQDICNNLFKKNGVYLVKDALDLLGFEGDIVDPKIHPELLTLGWLKGDESCDGKVDFRAHRVYRNIVDPETGEIVRIMDYALDFNHDGNVYTRLVKKYS